MAEEEEMTCAESLRKVLRANSRLIRRNIRDNLLDKRRGVDSSKNKELISAVEIQEIAVVLRKRGVTDIEMLNKLQSGLLQGQDRGSTFLATDGALNGLTKALSGLNPQLELKAAYCICNLSLTGGRAATKISKSAAPYLIVHMDGMNPLLQDASAWALGNLAAGGGHSWELLYAQGVLPKFVKLVNSPHADVVTAAIYALTHFVRGAPINLKGKELRSIIRNVAPLLLSFHTARLLFLLSRIPICDDELCASDVPENSVKKLAQMITNNVDLTRDSNLCELTFLIRTLANVSSESTCGGLSVIYTFMYTPKSLLPTLLSLPKYTHVHKETIWMLANLFKHPDEVVRALSASLLTLINLKTYVF